MTCATCIHWLPKEAGGMAKHRMAPCALRAKWIFLPPQQSCPKHTQAKPDVVSARTQWIAKSVTEKGTGKQDGAAR